MWLDIDKFKSRNDASVSEVYVLVFFNSFIATGDNNRLLQTT